MIVSASNNLPNLEIEGLPRSRGDLRRLLVKGGASVDARLFYRNATEDTWQNIITNRLPLIEAVKDFFETRIALGNSRPTIERYLDSFRQLVIWAESKDIELLLDHHSLKTAFIAYDEHNYLRAWGSKEIKKATSYATVFNASIVLSSLLDLPKHLELRHFSKVIKAHKGRPKCSVSAKAEKQHLGDTQALGYYCVDISNGLTIDAITGQLPILIDAQRPDGSKRTIHFPTGMKLKVERKKGLSGNYTCAMRSRAPTDNINATRQTLITIRLLAELVIFIYQTAMPISQVLRIHRKAFSYKAQGNSDWLITEHKGRAGGSVSFRIYKEYKEHFTQYIAFLNRFYPDDPYLFPLSSEDGKANGKVNYNPLKTVLKKHKVPWVPPRMTRNTRVNFLNRLIGNPDVSAEMAQHTKETFARKYDRPSQQRAMSALTAFWEANPISLINSGCTGKPEPTEDIPSNVIEPNCINESGCLWCKSHQDIESEDYVWALASFRKLKLIEAAQPIKREIPADRTIARLSEKIEAFRSLSDQSSKWTKEALLRIEEGRYHPTWESIINFWEAG